MNFQQPFLYLKSADMNSEALNHIRLDSQTKDLRRAVVCRLFSHEFFSSYTWHFTYSYSNKNKLESMLSGGPSLCFSPRFEKKTFRPAQTASGVSREQLLHREEERTWTRPFPQGVKCKVQTYGSITPHWNRIWLAVSTPLKNISQLGWFSICIICILCIILYNNV